MPPYKHPNWTTDNTLEFIELYSKEDIIWDGNHAANRNRVELYDAWERIRSSMSTDFTIAELKKKKESLMATFRTLAKRVHLNPKYRPCWFAYQAMASFLGSKYECDSTDIDDMETEFLDNTVTYFTSKEEESDVHIDDPISCHESSFIEVTKNNKNRSRDSKYVIKQSPQKNTNTVKYKHKLEYPEDQDECELYTQLLAKKLRKLDEHQRDIAMHEIDNILFRVKMQNNSSMDISASSSRAKSPIFIVEAQDSQYEEETLNYEAQNLEKSQQSS